MFLYVQLVFFYFIQYFALYWIKKPFFFFVYASCADETTLLLSNLLFSTILGTSVVNLE